MLRNTDAGVGLPKRIPIFTPVVLIWIIALLGCEHNPRASSTGSNECLPGQGHPSCFYKKTLDQKNKKLIIFVHGIFGNSVASWGHPPDKTFWPEMVKQDTRFVDSDIYFVNYKTPYFGGAPNIHEVSVSELGQLKSRNVFDYYQEIYFIAHSMGGLVTKSMLVQLNRGEDVARLRQIKGVIFLGAPAQGADLARLGAWLLMNTQLEPVHDLLRSL